ncbi:MAG: hypothetical protein QG622_446 [Actinomycetota bacterium]|nr:hypothetical protein [Actinomycetota bacterium]
MTSTSRWNDLAAQQLVRYEALFGLLDDIQVLEDLGAIATRVATQWKYFANVASWRVVVSRSRKGGFQVVDGAWGEARVQQLETLPAWDAQHWASLRPRLIRPDRFGDDPPPPEHLTLSLISEIEVLPFLRGDRCVGVLSVGARRQPFDELDSRFVRLFGRHFVDRLSDLLERQETTQALISKASKDELTGLSNRGAILDLLGSHLALASRTGEPLSVVLLDVDDFKAVNDTFGHLAGDDVLRELSDRLASELRDSDGLGRYGGEEFLCVLFPCSAAEARTAAERLRRAVGDRPFMVGALRQHTVTISLGSSSTDVHPEAGLQDLLKWADNALYRSKSSGRNRVTDDESFTGSPVEDLPDR